MAWQTPKTNWGQAGQTVPVATDFNRIEGNINYIEEESRTPSQTAIPAASGKLSLILSYFATQIKKITGKTNWYDAPSKTLEDLNSHLSDYAQHGVTMGHENDLYVAKIRSLFGFTPLEVYYGGNIFAIATDDEFVYVGGWATRTVRKLRKSDLSQVAESASYGGDINAIATDDEFVYVGGWTTQTVRKLDKSNLSPVATSANYGGTIRAIAVDDNHVYVGGATNRTVWRLDKSDLSMLAGSVDYGGEIRAIAVDNSYVYVGGGTTQTVKKLDKFNLSQVATSANYGGTISAIAADDAYV